MSHNFRELFYETFQQVCTERRVDRDIYLGMLDRLIHGESQYGSEAFNISWDNLQACDIDRHIYDEELDAEIYRLIRLVRQRLSGIMRQKTGKNPAIPTDKPETD